LLGAELLAGELAVGGGRGGFLLSMPNPGTDTPAAPNLLKAPWFIIPLCASGSELYCEGGVNGLEFVLGGNLGGRPGGFDFAAEGGGDITIRPSDPSFLPGGGGR